MKAEERQASTRFGGGAKICATEGKAVKLTIRKHLRRVSGGGNISTTEGKVRDIVAQKTGIGSGKQNEAEAETFPYRDGEVRNIVAAKTGRD